MARGELGTNTPPYNPGQRFFEALSASPAPLASQTAWVCSPVCASWSDLGLVAPASASAARAVEFDKLGAADPARRLATFARRVSCGVRLKWNVRPMGCSGGS